MFYLKHATFKTVYSRDPDPFKHYALKPIVTMATTFLIPSTHPRATSEVDKNSTNTVTSSLVQFDKTTPTGKTQY